jgi:hypothetical protein
MTLFEKVYKHGLGGSVQIATRMLLNHAMHGIYAWRYRNAPRYDNPSNEELTQIERDLARLEIEIIDYSPSPEKFRQFQEQVWFPNNYHGGRAYGVWDEKLLEHWIAADLLGLDAWKAGDIYVDIAACSSPWAKMLRERLGISAFAIDLAPVAQDYLDLPFYMSENATCTHFANESVQGASLQCAFEMFIGQDDQLLVHESEFCNRAVKW